MLINLCCGTYVYDGWLCCDPKTDLDPRIVDWRWGEPIPTGNETAEGILVTHSWIYAAKEDHPKHLAECLRVLKPGGVLVIKEEDDRKRVWRKVGTNHSSGLIRSTSNEPEMKVLMEAAGFQVEHGYPPEFEGPLDNHRKARKNAYVLTGKKV